MTYRGVTDLKFTRKGLTLPSQKILVLNKLVTSIYKEDSEFRMYLLSSNEEHLNEYLNTRRNVSAAIKSIQKLSYANSQHIRAISKVKKLISKKRQTEQELLQMRGNYNSDVFYDKAIKKIASAGEQTQRYAQIYRQKTITQVKRDTVIFRNPSSRSMASRIKRFFLGPDRIDTVTTDTLVEYNIDTIPNIAYISDSIINRLLVILNDIKVDQQRENLILSQKEKELLDRNKAILNQIQLVVSEIERNEQREVLNQSINIQEVISRTLLKILLLGAITFIVLIILLAIIFRDISRNAAYNSQLIEAKQYAESLLRLKEQFLANMSHEIRTPLSAIVGITRQLSKTNLSQKQKEYVNVLTGSSEHLLSVINDILDYSKLESGKLSLESRLFSPANVLSEVSELFHQKAEEKGLKVLFNADPSVPEQVWGDDFRLRQIIINLVSNAIKFTDKGSVIISASVLRQTLQSVKLQFTVADTGIGIPLEKQEQIFEEFTQADSSTSRRYGGTGLGLTLVKKLTELQGGEVSLSSQPNEGTIIKVVIPFSIKTSIEISVSDQTDYKLKASSTLLVIDDDEVNRLIVEEMAKSLGIQVQTLPSAHNLGTHLLSNKCDAIITDIQMPDISGYDVVEIVDKLELKIPVFAITANNMIENPEHFSNKGFSGYLIKPFTEDDLLSLLGPVIGITSEKNVTNHAEKEIPRSKFDLAEIYRFTGGDSTAVRLILESFLENTKHNINELNQHIIQQNLKKATAVAHKMKSAFNQFRVYDIAGLLQKIEQLPTGKQKAAQLYLEQLNKKIKPFIRELEGKIEDLYD